MQEHNFDQKKKSKNTGDARAWSPQYYQLV